MQGSFGGTLRGDLSSILQLSDDTFQLLDLLLIRLRFLFGFGSATLLLTTHAQEPFEGTVASLLDRSSGGEFVGSPLGDASGTRRGRHVVLSNEEKYLFWKP